MCEWRGSTDLMMTSSVDVLAISWQQEYRQHGMESIKKEKKNFILFFFWSQCVDFHCSCCPFRIGLIDPNPKSSRFFKKRKKATRQFSKLKLSISLSSNSSSCFFFVIDTVPACNLRADWISNCVLSLFLFLFFLLSNGIDLPPPSSCEQIKERRKRRDSERVSPWVLAPLQSHPPTTSILPARLTTPKNVMD